MILHPSRTSIAGSKSQAWGSGLHKEHKIILLGNDNVLKLSNIHSYTIYIKYILPKWNAFLIKTVLLKWCITFIPFLQTFEKCVYSICLSVGALLILLCVKGTSDGHCICV